MPKQMSRLKSLERKSKTEGSKVVSVGRYDIKNAVPFTLLFLRCLIGHRLFGGLTMMNPLGIYNMSQ